MLFPFKATKSPCESYKKKPQIEDDCVSTPISNTAGFCIQTDIKSQLHHPLGSKTFCLYIAEAMGCKPFGRDEGRSLPCS